MATSFMHRLIEGLFFDTDSRSYWDCRHFGLSGEKFVCPAVDDSSIHGVFLPAAAQDGSPAKGTVIFAHACLRNYGYNLPQVMWLVPSGYNVLTYDPRGSGDSKGTGSLASVEEDAESILKYALTREDVDKDKIILFGQNLGADAMIRMAARHQDKVAGLVVESLWATHAGYMLRNYGPGVGHFCNLFLPKNVQEPIDAMKQLHIPVAIVMPTKDRSVPEKEVMELIHAAPAHREVWRVEGARHLTVFSYPTIWRQRFVEFAYKAFENQK